MGQFYADRVAVGSHRARTPEGYLVVTGVPIARTGWQTYRASELRLQGDGDRLVKLYRDASEVFSPETIASFEGKSITSEHPPVFLTQENDAGYSKGHIQNIRKGGVLEDGNTGLLADLVIKDAMLIQQIETDAKSEVSCGYEYDTEPYGDSPDKFRMTFIRGNHLAVVKRGRAGSSVRILDSQPDDLVQEGGTDVSDEKFSLTDVVRAVGIALGIKSQQVTDSDPGAVERNRESMEAAREKRDRTMDAEKKEEKPVEEEKPKTAEVGDSKASDKKSEDKENPPVAEEKKTTDGELEKEEKGAKEPGTQLVSKDKKAKDADKDDEKSKFESKDADEDEKKEMKKASDAQDARISKLCDAVAGLGEIVGKLAARDAEKCTCDAEGDEEHGKSCPMFKKEAEDELIPVATLPEKDRPKNPIPGADAAATIESLRKIAPAVAKSGDRQAIDTLNSLYRTLKGVEPGRTGDGYRELANRGEKSREAGLERANDSNIEDADQVRATEFADLTKSYLGKHAGEVKIEKGGK